MNEPQTLKEHVEYGEFLGRIFEFLELVYAVEKEYWVDMDTESSKEQQQCCGWLREFLDKYIGPGKGFAGLTPEEKKAALADWGLLISATIIRKKQCLEIINSRSWEIAHAQIIHIFNGKRDA